MGKARVDVAGREPPRGVVFLMNDNDGAGSGGVRLLMCMEAVNIKEIERLLYAKLAPARQGTSSDDYRPRYGTS